MKNKLLYVVLGIISIVIVYLLIAPRAESFYAYIPNADEGTISVIDTKKDELVKTIKVDDVLSDGIEVSRDGALIYVGNYEKGQLLIVDAKSGEIVEKIATGKNLHGIDMTPDGKFLYLASGDFKEGEQYNYITVLDTTTNKITNEILTTSKSPSHIDFSRDGSLAYVANILSNDITLIDTKTQKIIATIPVGTIPNEVEPSSDDKYLFVANVTDGTVSIVDIVAQKEIDIIKAGEGTHGIAISPDGNYIYASNRASNDVVMIDMETKEVVNSIETGIVANHVSYVPDLNKLYVTNKDSNDLAVIDAENLTMIKKVSLGKTPHEISFAPSY